MWRGAILSGLFVGLLALLYMGVTLAVWVFLVPLLLLVWQGAPKTVLLCGTIAILASGLIWVGWVRLVNIKMYLLMLLVFCAFFAFFILGTMAVARTGLSLTLGTAIAWLCGSQLLSLTRMGNFWTELAMFQPMMAPMIWFTGAKGVTFLIVMVNAVFAGLCVQRTRRLEILAALLIGTVIGCFVFSSAADEAGRPLKVAAVQGNFSQSWGWRCDQAANVILDTYTKMTRQASEEEKPDLIVWPEYAIAQDIFQNHDLRSRIAAVASSARRPLLIGTLAWHPGTVDGEQRRSDVAALFSPDGALAGMYSSIRPVPHERCVVPGGSLHVLAAGEVRLGTMMCFEETIPAIARSLTLKGADLLVSLANNSQFKETRGIWLASLQTRLRAAENRKYLVRATNTGISQVVSPCGKIVESAAPFERRTLPATVRLNDRRTFYTTYGDPPFLCVVLALCGADLGRRYARRRRKVENKQAEPENRAENRA